MSSHNKSNNQAKIIKKVCVIMATFNGSRYLPEQMESIANQTDVRVSLVIVDDCSSCLEKVLLKEQIEHIHIPVKLIFNEKRVGPSTNFMRAIREYSGTSDYFAFADQDDVWAPDKLKVAIDQLEKLPKGEPNLYCARTSLVDERLKPIGLAPLKKKKPNFSHALAQSIAGGNTMVFNERAKILLEITSTTSNSFVAHDWWSYIVISGAGGNVFYDPIPKVLYRQHSSNVIGANNSLKSIFKRFTYLRSGVFQIWNNSNCHNIELNASLFTNENLNIARRFFNFRNGNIFERVRAVLPMVLQRETIIGKFGIFLGALLRKI